MKQIGSNTRMDSVPQEIFHKIEQGFRETPEIAPKALTIFAVDTDYDGFETSEEYTEYTEAGQAEIIAHNGKDFPLLDEHLEKKFRKIVKIGEGMTVEKDVLDAIAAGKASFKDKRARTNRKHINQKIDDVVWNGDNKYAVPGLKDVTGTVPYVAPNGTDGSPLWSIKSAFEILEDIRMLHREVAKSELWTPDTLLLPPTRYSLLLKAMSPDNPRTVLSYVIEEGLFRSVQEIAALETGSSTDGPVTYAIDTDMDNMQISLVKEAEEHNRFIDEGGNLQVNHAAKTGGLKVYFSQAIGKCENI